MELYWFGCCYLGSIYIKELYIYVCAYLFLGEFLVNESILLLAFFYQEVFAFH